MSWDVLLARPLNGNNSTKLDRAVYSVRMCTYKHHGSPFVRFAMQKLYFLQCTKSIKALANITQRLQVMGVQTTLS